MIDTLVLKNFKAYNDFELNFKNENLLIYGDNGTGKSSIYEAFKMAFFKKRLIDGIVYKSEEKEEKINEVLSREYDNKNAVSFEIKLNGKSIKADSNTENFNFNLHLVNLYSVEMSNIEKGESKKDTYKTLNLEKLLLREYVSVDLSNIVKNKESIEEKVNGLLKEFKEDIFIKIDDSYNVIIIDEKRNIKENNKYLNLYFNEAKLNLVVLLLIFVSIELDSKSDKKSVVVLDDFITSLDIANRTFILKYILETFNNEDYQLVVLTHNLEFFNLVKYILTEKMLNANLKWQYKQLYELNETINKSHIEPICFELINKKITENPSEAGNLIRKKFESLIHALAKDLISGSIESSNNILTTFLNNETLYLKTIGGEKKKKFLTSNNLVYEIEKLIKENKSLSDVETLISEYKIPNDKLKLLKDILNNLKLYRKVIMHPLSHTESQFSTKELYQSIDLLKQLDESIVEILNTNTGDGS
jgi:DNA repair exonuclease SbcCD ATPase subunit